MANFTALRIGQTNQAGDDLSLFLKVYSGEVLTAFHKNTVMMSRHRQRTIASGKSATFPVTGTITASYHNPGVEITGQNANNNERVINIDKLLIAPVFIPNIDEAMNHYEYRSIYSNEAGVALAQKFDRNTLQLAILAARTAALNADHPAGTQVGNNTGFGNLPNMASVAADFKSALTIAAQALDEKNVQASPRFAVIRPAQYWLLFSAAVDTNVMNRDIGGAGSAASGNWREYAGLEVVKSNNIPSTNIGADSDERNTYTGNFTKTVGVVFGPEAIGTVKLLDIATESEYSVRHQGTLMVAKYAMGHGVLRPQCSAELCIP